MFLPQHSNGKITDITLKIQLIAGHNAYCGCYYCLVHGVWAGRVTFPDAPPFEPRAGWHYNDQHLMLSALGYNGVPALASLSSMNFDPILDHALDAMHNCFLGIAKTLFTNWFKPVPVCLLSLLSVFSNEVHILAWNCCCSGQHIKEIDKAQ